MLPAVVMLRTKGRLMHCWKHCNIYTVGQGSGNISHNMGMVRMQEVEDKEKLFKMLSSGVGDLAQW